MFLREYYLVFPIPPCKVVSVVHCNVSVTSWLKENSVRAYWLIVAWFPTNIKKASPRRDVTGECGEHVIQLHSHVHWRKGRKMRRGGGLLRDDNRWRSSLKKCHALWRITIGWDYSETALKCYVWHWVYLMGILVDNDSIWTSHLWIHTCGYTCGYSSYPRLSGSYAKRQPRIHKALVYQQGDSHTYGPYG